jgi:hypothetical protein
MSVAIRESGSSDLRTLRLDRRTWRSLFLVLREHFNECVEGCQIQQSPSDDDLETARVAMRVFQELSQPAFEREREVDYGLL